MKKEFAVAAVLALCTMSPLAQSAHSAQASKEQQTISKLTDLSFLQGRWIQAEDGTDIVEEWTAPRGDTMLGSCRFINDGKATFFEFLVLQQEAKGVVLKMRHFNGEMKAWSENEVGDCVLQSWKKNEAIFEDKMRQGKVTIKYQRISPTTMLVAVNETRPGKSKSAAFKYTLQK